MKDDSRELGRANSQLSSVGTGKMGSGKPETHGNTKSTRLRFFRSKPLSDRAAILILFGVALVTGLPLMTGRVLAGQDIVNYLIHAQQTAANMRELTFFPSWGGGYNAGFGSPVLLFFPPFTSVIHAVPVLLGIPVISGVSLLAILGHLLSGIVIFKWLRSDRPVVPALAAALVYMVAPYRPIDLYFRSALAEHWAFLWPPIILWASGASRLLPTTRVFVVAGAVAGLLLTNTPRPSSSALRWRSGSWCRKRSVDAGSTFSRGPAWALSWQASLWCRKLWRALSSISISVSGRSPGSRRPSPRFSTEASGSGLPTRHFRS